MTEIIFITHTNTQKGVVEEAIPFYRVYQNYKKLKIYCRTQRLIDSIVKKDKDSIRTNIKNLIPKRHD
jgi:hypothetical protein